MHLKKMVDQNQKQQANNSPLDKTKTLQFEQKVAKTAQKIHKKFVEKLS